METIDKTCDICYKEISNKVTLKCKHELCVMCFLEMTTSSSSSFKCHMCRKQYNWKKEENKESCIFVPKETLSILIREDEDCQFRALVGMETRVFPKSCPSLSCPSFFVRGQSADKVKKRFLH